MDLTERTLVGFRIVTSDFIDGRRNIRAVCPIVQELDCSEATIEIGDLNEMIHDIGTGEQT